MSLAEVSIFFFGRIISTEEYEEFIEECKKQKKEK
jgi:hypothetical protein